MTFKNYDYINDIGEPKKIIVKTANKEGYYDIVIFSRRTGDMTGYGHINEKELIDFLKHYNLI